VNITRKENEGKTERRMDERESLMQCGNNAGRTVYRERKVTIGDRKISTEFKKIHISRYTPSSTTGLQISRKYRRRNG
jgi:hypothetical protein